MKFKHFKICLKLFNFGFMKIVLINSFFLLNGCNSSITTFQDNPIKVLEKGVWSWDGNTDNCKIATQEIFKIEEDAIKFTWYDVEKSIVDNTHQSNISSISGGYINFMPKEEGETQYWTLIVKSDVEFCWRRSDWNPLSCTNAMIRCN